MGDKKLYQKIVESLEEQTHTVLVRDLFDTREDASKVAKNKNYVREFKKDLDKADFMVAEITSTSSSVGIEIAIALEKSKHVILMSEKKLEDLSPIITDNPSRYLHVQSYTEKNISETLEKCIKSIKKKLFYPLFVELSSKHGEMIEKLQKVTGKSKKQIIEEAVAQELYKNDIDQ